MPAGVEVIIAEHKIELLLAEVLVYQGQRKDVEGKIPRRVPRVLPLVGHRDDMGFVHVMPVLVARRSPSIRFEGIGPCPSSQRSTS